MKKSVLKNTSGQVKEEIQPAKQNRKIDPVCMVELRSQICLEYDRSIRNFNESHKPS